jgi:hypothetical protein
MRPIEFTNRGTLLDGDRPGFRNTHLQRRPRNAGRRHPASATDLGVPMIGVTLLHRQGYFRQRLV